ncbi:MAG: fructose 1,6-bisphosphatase, partial [Anaerolineales bacterium]|nr:fructose 1,6-bisphosphatase [Anaerolineales bacterium]
TCWQKPFGNIKEKGSGEADLAFIEQKSEPIIIVMTDKTSVGSRNLPFY